LLFELNYGIMCKSANSDLKRNRKMYSLRKRCDMSVFFINDVEQSNEYISDLDWVQHSAALNPPHCLFKYFPNSKYSKEALANNTVHLSAPSDFDDPYYCNVYIDGSDFAVQRVRYYASLCGVAVKPEWDYAEISRHLSMCVFMHITSGGKVASLFELDKTNDLIHAHQEYFLFSLENELLKERLNPDASGESYYRAINHVIENEYSDMQKTANRFRIACFAQTPYSMLMWSHYAKYHQGFCIEYETPEYSDDNIDIYHNLFPVIYTDTRTPLTEITLSWNSMGTLTNENLWDFYKYCLLSKSLDWKYQQEWRLISCDTLIRPLAKIKKV